VDESPEAVEDQLAELAGLLLTNETLETTLQHVAQIAVRAIPACDAAGVSLAEDGRMTTAAVTTPFVNRVDDHQYATDEGPCLETLRTGEPRRSPSLETETRWSAFRPRAMREGVVSCLSIPLVVGNGTAGALNLYSRANAFAEYDEEVGRGFAAPASVAIANARAYAKANLLIEQLEQALQSRDVIGQAKGIIQAREGKDPDGAFARLRAISQHENIKLRDIAQAVVDDPDRVLGPSG
jgi:GAF domain-containing protein